MSEETMHREWTDLLSGYLDDELDVVTRRRLEAHLVTCPECTAVKEELTRVIAVAPGYRGAEPVADLWPRIAAEIDTGRMVALPASRSSRWRAVGQLIAAGLAVAAVGTGIYQARRVDQPATMPTVAVARDPESRVLPAGFQSKEYDAAVAELEKTLAEGRSSLDTSTVRVLDESLKTIDRAIAEARAAIQRDTANSYLNGQIAGNLRKKLNMLRLATRAIASET